MELQFSKFNIFSKIRDSENYFIVNPLSRNADILDPEKAREIIDKNYTGIDEYIEKGYLVEGKEEERKNKLAYLDFIDQRDDSEVQIFFVPHYSCNFACSYCYQDEYEWETLEVTEDVIKAFFDYVESEFAGKKKYVTIFGGEPLLPGDKKKENMTMIMNMAAERGVDIAVVTNGYHVADYIDILSIARIREIQITLDGTGEVHDNRRPLKGGKGTFSTIVEGIDMALGAGMPVNLRVVLDRDNIENLPALAELAVERGWTSNPLFKSQFGRNYELHHCQANNSSLFDRVGLYERIYELIQEHPSILEFHRPTFSISRFLFENGEMPEPLYDSCPGCKTEWAFDYTGKIYPCTATVGKKGESVGTFYPEISRKDDIIEEWEERDVTSIPECKECSLQLLCGGGCGSVAKNNTGNLHSPDCRPVKELLEMGISLYFEKEN